MAFHDVRLPEEVERGVRGGPRFKTTVLILRSGHEKRNQDWTYSRGEWDVGYGMLTKDDDSCDHTFTEVLEFFYARQGRANSFRFKDWSDFTIGVAFGGVDAPQSIGVGDGVRTTFQIFKRYTSGPSTYDRIIYKPVSGTVRVFLAGIEQFAGFTVDYDTGIITFAPAPGGAVNVSVICEFDCAVRFDTDAFDVTLQTFQAGAIPNLPIVELRVLSSGEA